MCARMCVVCYRIQWTRYSTAVQAAGASDERRTLIGRQCRSLNI